MDYVLPQEITIIKKFCIQIKVGEKETGFGFSRALKRCDIEFYMVISMVKV